MRTLAFILFVVCITAAVGQIQLVFLKGMETESIYVKDYNRSKSFIHSIGQNMYDVMYSWDKKQVEYNLFYYSGDNLSYSTPFSEEKFSAHYRAYYSDPNKGWVYLTYPEYLIEDRQEEWENTRERLFWIIFRGIILAVVGFLALIYVILTTTLKPNKEGKSVSRLDRANTEGVLALLCISTGALIYIIHILLNSVSPFTDFDKDFATSIFTDYYSKNVLRIFNISLVVAILTTLSGIFLLTLVRKTKAGNLLENCVLNKFIRMAYRVGKKLFIIVFEGRMFHGYPLLKTLTYRQQVVTAASLLLTFFSFVLSLYEPAFILINILLQAAVFFWYYCGNKTLYEDIDEEMNESMEEQMKAERMKVNLITNVSHDLKTPLTSIISYLDLLAKEDDLSETVEDYVKVLQAKSERLKTIVTDIFDLAKSTSGDLTLDIQEIDMKKLIEQTIADMGDKIEGSLIPIKATLPDYPVNISADGKRMYRVFQNLIDNALTYSLKGTRIFIELNNTGNKSIATIKNTASYEMDFTAEEVLQRFSRGDKSRTTEGSGLGLSIAESFTKVCGGDFKIEIDGDLFKVSVEFASGN
jgi:signal transduction histidine kinase